MEEGETDEISMRDCVCTPIKSCWILPIFKDEIAVMLNMSNIEVTNLITNFVKEIFITSSLLQNAQTFAREKIFGDPSKNALFATALVELMKEGNHDVQFIVKGLVEVLRMLECMDLSNKIRKNKASGNFDDKA